MLSIGKLATGGESYYLEAVASGAEDYYLGAGEAPGAWAGRGAAAFGLRGEVAAEELRFVMAGRSPAGEVLAEAPGGRRRLPGYDLTFSAPKSVSLLYALGDARLQYRVVAAHEDAVAAALRYLEDNAAYLRRGHAGREIVRAQGLLASTFRHRTSRAQDPALHTHVLVANAGIGRDGRSGALDGRALYRHAATAGYLYQAELRHRLSCELGVEWSPVRRGQAEIAGFPAEVLRAFSRRRQDIEAELGERGEDGARAARMAALLTRRAKGPLPVGGALHGEWRERAAELGFGREDLRATLGRAPWPVLEPERLSEVAAHLAGPEGLTESRSHFDRRRVVRAVSELAGAGAAAREVERMADAFLASSRVVELPGAGPAGEPGFTTPELLRLEADLVERALARRRVGAATAPEEVVAEAIRRRPALTGEQAEMVRRLLTDGDGVAVVRGRAGAGKTYALDPTREAWEDAGHRVVGAALSARAAAELEAGSGIPSGTVAGLLLALGDPGLLDGRTVVVIDEAAMVGTRQLARLVAETARAEAKLVLVGDDAQLPEIAAGGAFRGLAERLDVIHLEGNRRQEGAWERQALLDIREGRAESAVRAYELAGRITVAETAEEAREHLVHDWYEARAAGDDCLMVAARRRDAHDLSRRARELLLTAGEVSGLELAFPTGRFALGDRVMAMRNRRALGVQNGLRATVVRVDTERKRLELETDDGRRLLMPRDYLEAGHLTHGYAVTAHKAQGVTVERAFVLGSEEVTREWGYTALSRARAESRLYLVGGEPLRDALAAELGGRHELEERDALDQLVHDLGQSRAQEMSIDLGL
jgi:conjugative relaxase-like TrwC/TraI family protein